MKHLFVIVLILTFGGCVSSERTIFLKVPPPGERDTTDFSTYEKEYGNVDGVFLDIDENIEHSGRSESGGLSGTPWKYNYVFRRKYLVLNPDAEYLTTFSLDVPKVATIGALYLQVTPPGGATARYGIKNLVKEATSESSLKYKFIYPNIQKGSVIEEGYDLSYDGYNGRAPMSHEIPMQFRIPCEKVSFTYAYPDWWKIQVKRTGDRDTIPSTSWWDREHHKKVVTCSAVHVPAVKDEPFSPFFKEMAKCFEFNVTVFQMGPLNFKSPGNWNELLARFAKSMTKREGGVFSTRVDETTEELTANKQTQLEKLTAILDYVQAQIEEVRDYEYRDFADVLREKKGAGYTIAGLTNMMFQKAGLTSDLLMVHSASEGYFDSSYYSLDQLPIPAVDVRADGAEYVVLPYRKDIPYDYIPEYLQGQQAMVISDESEVAKFITIPSGSRTKNSIDEKLDCTIGQDGVITVDGVKTIQGSYAYYLRETLSGLKQVERDKFMKELVSYAEGQVRFDHYVLENENEYKKPLVLRYTYGIDNLITLMPDEVLFHTAGLLSPTSLKVFQLESESRSNPIRVYFDDEYVKEIAIRYPDKWELFASPDPVDVENSFGSLKSEVKKTPYMLNIKQRRLLNRSSEPKEKIAEFAKLTGNKRSTVAPTIVFRKTH